MHMNLVFIAQATLFLISLVSLFTGVVALGRSLQERHFDNGDIWQILESRMRVAWKGLALILVSVACSIIAEMLCKLIGR